MIIMTTCKLFDVFFNTSFHHLQMGSHFHNISEMLRLISDILILDVFEALLTESWLSLSLLLSLFVFYILVLANYLQLLNPLSSILTFFRLLNLLRLRQENVLSFCVTVEVWSAIRRDPHIIMEIEHTDFGGFFRIVYHRFQEPL